MIRIYEMGGDAELRQGIGEELIGTAVQCRGRNDLIPGTGNVQNRIGDSSCPGSNGESRRAAFQSGQSLFEYILGRIRQATIDITGILQGEAVFCLLRVLEYIGSGLVNRNRSGAGHRIRYLACMLLKSFEMIMFYVCHDEFLL